MQFSYKKRVWIWCTSITINSIYVLVCNDEHCTNQYSHTLDKVTKSLFPPFIIPFDIRKLIQNDYVIGEDIIDDLSFLTHLVIGINYVKFSRILILKNWNFVIKKLYFLCNLVLQLLIWIKVKISTNIITFLQFF